MASGTLKAIETRYKGYRFRSRLEARWAVYLDTVGLNYEYEPEGFTLENGEQYLPDFWLPGLRSYSDVRTSSEGRGISACCSSARPRQKLMND
jgi:hypothetical protein